MDLIKITTPDFVFNDNRGSLVQLVHSGYKQINSVFTKKDAVRGNFHYHKNTDETFFVVSGKVKVTAYYKGKKQDKTFSCSDMFIIEKNIRHTFKYLEDTYLIVLYQNEVEAADGTKDIWSD